jgi:CPA1 family monovalent cation:H+ antiporter
MHERELIPEYGEGIISVRNLDAMMRNAGRMVEAARTAGRIGYNRTAQQILELPRSYHLAQWLYRRAGLEWPLAGALAQRFELIVCRRAVLSRLQEYNRSRLAPVLGERVVRVLDSVIAIRCVRADRAIQSMRRDFGEFSHALERRFLSLFALRRGRMAVRTMAAEQVISKEVMDRVEQQIDRAWQRAIKRPQLRVQELEREPV